MSAGKSATSTEAMSHHTAKGLPYSPIGLRRGKRDSREVFVFESPKGRRIATIAELPNFCLALLLEFDPSIAQYVERPRRISLAVRRELELSFWTRGRDGSESYLLVVPDKRVAASSTGLVKLPPDAELVAVAMDHGINLRIVTQAELTSQAHAISSAFELLPLVNASARLQNRSEVAAKIMAITASAARMSVKVLIQHIDASTFAASSIVAWLIHRGNLSLIDYLPGASDAFVEVKSE
jgi:hypothetical protein